MSAQLDHIVVMAADLESGVAWCERTLGVTPGPGGEHPLMGTHNRLLRITAPGFADSYLEIIALKPGAVPQRAAPLRRWFDFDDAALAKRVQQQGPQLVHWVARTGDVRAALAAWQALGIDRGPPLAASRMTPDGLLQWQITVRDDGQRLFDGCLPTLIEWGAVHPAPRMAPCGLALCRLTLAHPQAAQLERALSAVGLLQPGRIELSTGAPGMQATFDTPHGQVTLSS